MVLEVLANGGEIHDGIHADFLQEGAVANTRDLEKLRGVQRASRQDGLDVDAHSRLGRGRRSRELEITC